MSYNPNTGGSSAWGDITGTLSAQTDLQSALDAKQPSGSYQPSDADLTAIAALNSATSGTIASDGAGWIHKTYAALKTALGLVKADVGLGSVVDADTTTTANITDSSNKRFVTDAQQTVIGNTSGTNTGDNATNTQYSGLAASKLDATAFSGLTKITVGTSTPVAPSTGDLWIDTN